MNHDQPRITKWYQGNTLIWIAYTGFLFIEPVVERRWEILPATIVVFLLFLPLYFAFLRACTRQTRLRMIALIVLLGTITFPWNGGGCTFFIYAAAFLPFAVVSPVRVLVSFAGMIGIMATETQWVHWHGHHESWYGTLFNGFLLMMIGGGNIFFAQQSRSESKLKLKQEEVEAMAAVAERERIARDLHDVLGHTLSLIVLKAELAGRLIDRDPTRAASEINEVERTARTALAEVREAIGGYRSRGLAAEVEAARRTLATAGVTLHVDADDVEAAKLTAAQETVLALALREAVTNIVRHAQATTARLSFEHHRGALRLIVQDNGSNHAATEGNGLRGMRERVEALGGTLTLDRRQGTRLEVGLPGTAIA